ncbi:hypothetical protein MHUMG1_01437 [Metarhizium humberi]|uniref:Uncharacterized protein n=1 Tax=Metarhizium humberi TaxID=2596975 RepID=A0A9P8MHS2_9HYPO|nr:hypothetical protein MHUMG1_01437 [Metarhizium humberi]
MTTSATDVIPPAHEAAGICTAPCRADELNMHHARTQGRDLQCDSQGRGTTEWPGTAGHSLHAARDEADDALVYSNLGDSRVLVFWLLLLATQLATALWLGIVVLLAKMPVLSRVSGPAPRAKGESAHLLADAWSSLTLSTTVDAVAVLATFNGPVIRRFHYAVSQRIMILASIMSFLLSSCNEKASFVARYPVESVAVACALYALFCLLLDSFEKTMHASDADCSWRRLSEYSQRFCRAQSTWGRALIHSAVIAAVGLFLTALIPAPWSSVIPVVQILFERGGTPFYTPTVSLLKDRLQNAIYAQLSFDTDRGKSAAAAGEGMFTWYQLTIKGFTLSLVQDYDDLTRGQLAGPSSTVDRFACELYNVISDFA